MNKFILYTIIAFSFTACFKERIELDYNKNENKKIVIVGWLNDIHDNQFVTVSQTVNYLGSIKEDLFGGAEVTLSTTGESYNLQELEIGKYYLPADWKGIIGNTYTLTVLADGKEYTASHKMRPCPEIVAPKFEIVPDTLLPDGANLLETVFSFQEIPGEGDAYFAIDYKAGTNAGDSLINGEFANDEYVDGEFFDDIYISEYERLFALGDTAVIELFSIGIETANFLVDIELEIFRGGPFDPPPANVRTNFDGGAVGYFIISAANQKMIVKE